MPQRRRRIFILGYLKNSSINKTLKNLKEPDDWILKNGVIAKAFKVVSDTKNTISKFGFEGSLEEITLEFNKGKAKESPFKNSGIMINRNVWTVETKANYKGPQTILQDIILLNGKVPEQYYINENNLEKWQYMKGAKKEKRTDKRTGFEYSYNEGAMVFPDALDKPSRTIITGEGGSSPSRFKHVIKTKDGKFRRLMPLELERLNMFPDNHTEGASDIKRAFFMGNALIVGVVEKIAKELIKNIAQ
jgi:DNA (cytosine-5)-methyltransferase 1